MTLKECIAMIGSQLAPKLLVCTLPYRFCCGLIGIPFRIAASNLPNVIRSWISIWCVLCVWKMLSGHSLNLKSASYVQVLFSKRLICSIKTIILTSTLWIPESSPSYHGSRRENGDIWLVNLQLVDFCPLATVLRSQQELKKPIQGPCPSGHPLTAQMSINMPPRQKLQYQFVNVHFLPSNCTFRAKRNLFRSVTWSITMLTTNQMYSE